MVRWVRLPQLLQVKFLVQRSTGILEVYSFRCTNPDQIPGLQANVMNVTCDVVPFLADPSLFANQPPGVVAPGSYLSTQRTPNRTWGSDGGFSHKMELALYNFTNNPATWSITPLLGVVLPVRFPYELDPISMKGDWYYDGPAPLGVTI
jgi:hypothetical protein